MTTTTTTTVVEVPLTGDVPREIESEMRALSELVVPTFTLAVVTAKASDNRVLEVAVAGEADLLA